MRHSLSNKFHSHKYYSKINIERSGDLKLIIQLQAFTNNCSKFSISYSVTAVSLIVNKPKMNVLNATPKRSIEDILPLTFFIMKFGGLWEPFEQMSFFKIAYSVYTVLTMFTMVTIGISQVCVILFSSGDIKEVIVENSFLLFTLFNAWVKAIIILLRRKDIKSLLKVLLEDPSQPLDSEEHEIQSEFDEEAR